MILMKEIKPVLSEKHNFNHREEAFLITTSWNFWTIENLIQESIAAVFQLNPFLWFWGSQLVFLIMKSNLELLREVSLNNEIKQY